MAEYYFLVEDTKILTTLKELIKFKFLSEQQLLVMVTSEFIASFLGIYILIVSLVFLIRHNSFVDYVEEFAENTHMRYNVAFAELALGLAIVLLNNVWTLGYRGVITVIGWMMLIEAVFHLLAADEQEKKLIGTINQHNYWQVIGLVSLVLGLYLATKGFTGF